MSVTFCKIIKTLNCTSTNRLPANKCCLHNFCLGHGSLSFLSKTNKSILCHTQDLHRNQHLQRAVSWCFSTFHNTDTMEKFLTDKFFVNGQWKETDSIFPVNNPYSNQLIANAADCNQSDVEVAIGHASDAFKKWKKTTGKVRTDLILI